MRKHLRSPLIIALLAALAGWALQAADPLGHTYWNVVYKLWHDPAPSSIVVVTGVDANELGVAGEARLLDIVRQAKPSRMFLDFKLQGDSAGAGDDALRAAIARLSRDTAFVVRSNKNDRFDAASFNMPDPGLIGHRPVVLSAWSVNFLFFAESSPNAIVLGGVRYPVLATVLAGGRGGLGGTFYPDFAVDPQAIPTIPARRLLDGHAPLGLLTGKQVIVAGSAQGTGAAYFGHQVPSPYALDVAGAASLERPFPISLTALPLLGLAGLMLWWAGRSQRPLRNRIYFATVAAVLVLPIGLRMLGIVCYPDSALFALIVFSGMRLWQERTRKIQQTSASGLPNMLALSNNALPVGCDVVVAAVARYEEIMATLPIELHGECAIQIARRIGAGSGATDIYHSDGGHFAWTEEARPLDMQLSHLEGLRALFGAPLQIGPNTFDINIHFGLDRNEGVESATRVNSALASANEALTNGRAIELFEAHRLAEAPWELSLHARIDEGLRNGDIWLAYQAQWDLATNRICGAEALIRWNHPTRGPIAPNAFILQAERAGRIDALTYWVLDQAAAAARTINAKGPRFQMSVNLSGQMVDKPDLVRTFGEIVARRAVDPGLITVEVTETSSLGNRTAAVHNLTQLRQLGFRLSIDDFGTGEASLAYLADLPSDELKLDRRFVARIVDSDRERAIVASTIGLAHALGQTVVAEGIEDAATLALLRSMGCDHAQGFFLGRPKPFAVFEREYDDGGLRQFGYV